MSWFEQNLAETLFIIGLIILIVEVTVLSFSTIILFMIGAATIITSVTMYIGVISDDLLNALLIIAVLTAILALVLWKPFKGLQNIQENKPVTSDLVGFTFVLAQDVEPNSVVKYKYSGIDWKLISPTVIRAQTKVKVIAVNVGEWEIIALN
ncbi:MAG: NfeD family protein [Glaciecola sp.]|jgi:membrane protein implicated in regulation of membrane protease activity